jgi:threonine dehydrogenase-like Zn-dependent dehydrogenase
MKAVAVTSRGKIEIVEMAMPHREEYECLVRMRASAICSSTDLKIIDDDIGEKPVPYPVILGHEGVGEIVEVGPRVRNLKVGDVVLNPSSRIDPVPAGGPAKAGTTNGGGPAKAGTTNGGGPAKAGTTNGGGPATAGTTNGRGPAKAGTTNEAPGPSDRSEEGRTYTSMWANMREYATAQDVEAMREMGLDRGLYAWWRPMLVPREIPFEDAAVLLPQKEALSGVRNLGVRAGMDILIFGDGPMSQSLAMFARLEGARTIGCVGHRAERLERIGSIGTADFVIDSHEQEVRAAVGDRRFDLVIDAVGATAIIREGARLLRPGGKVGVFGVLSKKDCALSLMDLPNHSSVHMLNYPHEADGVHDEVIRMALDGRIRLRDCYSHVVPMAEAARGVEMIRTREAFKVVLRVGGAEG